MRKPDWLKVRLPGGEAHGAVQGALARGRLHTVCEEARCPNRGECWRSGTATFLILGGTCTRGCAFCAVPRGCPAGAIDPGEPARVAAAVKDLKLSYAVVTSVTRDDLPDGGAALFAATIQAIRALAPPPLVEVLIPDYLDSALQTILDARPEVLAHNLETVERLTPSLRHPAFSYRRSLETLSQARGALTKSSLLLGLGETEEEILAACRDLRAAGVEILVLGQYLQPSRGHAPVRNYIPPAAFDALADRARALGFSHVVAGPLVRTSYKAAEAYVAHRLGRPPEGAP